MVGEAEVKNNSETLKILCSYGGKILPRSTDGELRYVGGLTRIFSVDRSISFSELMVKLGELCGLSVTLRCQLPNGDLETLISIKSDDELANLLEEYDRASSTSKIRAILAPPASLKQVSPPSSMDFPANKQPFPSLGSCPSWPPASGCPVSSTKQAHRISGSRLCLPPYVYPVSGKVYHYPSHMQGNPRSLYCGSRKNY